MTLLQQQARNGEVCEPHASGAEKEKWIEILQHLESKGHSDTVATFVFMCCFFWKLSSLNAELTP